MDRERHLFGDDGPDRADPALPAADLGLDVPEADALDQAIPAGPGSEPDPESGMGDDEPPGEADPADVSEQRTEVPGIGEDEVR